MDSQRDNKGQTQQKKDSVVNLSKSSILIGSRKGKKLSPSNRSVLRLPVIIFQCFSKEIPVHRNGHTQCQDESRQPS